MNEERKGFDTYTEDTAEEGVSYIQPSIELKLSKEKKEVCRQIVKEIRNFGVSQRQLVFLIELLALEVENREVMLAIKQAVASNREKVPVQKIVIE
jgi:hypothetical protein